MIQNQMVTSGTLLSIRRVIGMGATVTGRAEESLRAHRRPVGLSGFTAVRGQPR